MARMARRAPVSSLLSFGALAQLGERLICIQEVIGSIPIGSTRSLWGFGVAHRFVRTDDLLWQIARLHQPVVGKAQNTQEDRVGSSGG